MSARSGPLGWPLLFFFHRGIPRTISSFSLYCCDLPSARRCFDGINMKLLYFSSDSVEVEQVSREFVEAGIPCEVRIGFEARGAVAHSCSAELWIRNDQDSHRALMLCVELGVGFAKRPAIPHINGF